MSAPVTARSSMNPRMGTPTAGTPQISTAQIGTSQIPVTASVTTPTPGRYLCFGGFQLDTQRELLFKDGNKMRLPGKVFHTLVALLEKPGEVVTRETLRERLWPEGTFVNYDANVNTTVNKLRLVLGDSPDQPEFIETIPRLGYCFVGCVVQRSELLKAGNEAAAARATAGAEKAVAPENGAPVTERKPAVMKAAPASAAELWSGWRSKGLAAVVLLCGMLIGMGIVFLAHRA
jgi:DNA-binding winged helix-turn-helix (wHTH) protein